MNAKILCLAIALGARAFAAPTHVVGELRDATNALLNGQATLSWRAFTSQDGLVLYPAATLRILVAVGNFDARLEPGYYVMEYQGNTDPSKTTLYLAVPASGAVVNLTACVLADLTKLAVSQLAQSAATTGQVLRWSGANWTPAALGDLAGPFPISSITGLQAALDGKPAIAAVAQRPFTQTVTAQTAVTIVAATHGLTSSAIDARCYNAAGQLEEYDTLAVDTSTFAVTITWAVAFTGRCVLR